MAIRIIAKHRPKLSSAEIAWSCDRTKFQWNMGLLKSVSSHILYYYSCALVGSLGCSNWMDVQTINKCLGFCPEHIFFSWGGIRQYEWFPSQILWLYSLSLLKVLSQKKSTCLSYVWYCLTFVPITLGLVIRSYIKQWKLHLFWNMKIQKLCNKSILFQ